MCNEQIYYQKIGGSSKSVYLKADRHGKESARRHKVNISIRGLLYVCDGIGK